ncbi:MAG: hypothetical protein WC717_04440 [Candidatus Micrarchaeia archaeon]|jgi:hypothetical protein
MKLFHPSANLQPKLEIIMPKAGVPLSRLREFTKTLLNSSPLDGSAPCKVVVYPGLALGKEHVKEAHLHRELAILQMEMLHDTGNFLGLSARVVDGVGDRSESGYLAGDGFVIGTSQHSHEKERGFPSRQATTKNGLVLDFRVGKEAMMHNGGDNGANHVMLVSAFSMPITSLMLPMVDQSRAIFINEASIAGIRAFVNRHDKWDVHVSQDGTYHVHLLG